MLYRFRGDPKGNGDDPRILKMYGFEFELNGNGVDISDISKVKPADREIAKVAKQVIPRHNHFVRVTPQFLRLEAEAMAKKAQELLDAAEEEATRLRVEGSKMIAAESDPVNEEDGDVTDERATSDEGASGSEGRRRRRNA
jgi:hypothetical protein